MPQKDGLEKRKGRKNSTSKIGKQCSDSTTCAPKSPSTQSSWAHLDKAEQGLGVETSSASQPWRLQEWDRVPGKVSGAKMTAQNSTHPESLLKRRRGHGQMLLYHCQNGISATPPLGLKTALKWPTSSLVHKGAPSTLLKSGQPSMTWSRRTVASEERAFDELVGLALERHSPLSRESSVGTNDCATKSKAMDKAEFPQSTRRWGLGSKQTAVCQVRLGACNSRNRCWNCAPGSGPQGGKSNLPNGSITTTTPPRSAPPLGSKGSMAINIGIAKLEANPIGQPAKNGAMHTLMSVRGDVQGSKQTNSGTDPRPGSGHVEGTTSGPRSMTGSGTYPDSGSAKHEVYTPASDSKGEDGDRTTGNSTSILY